MRFETNQEHIEATEVKEHERLAALVCHFGNDCIEFESMLYQVMENISPGYNGGYWRIYELNNDGFYMAPAAEKNYQIEVVGNGFQGILNSDAAGVVATIFALNYLIAENKSERLIYKYHLLLDYAGEHKEASKIFSAID